MVAKTDLVSERCLENLEVRDSSKISYVKSDYSLLSSSFLCNKSFSHWDGSLISLTTVKESHKCHLLLCYVEGEVAVAVKVPCLKICHENGYACCCSVCSMAPGAFTNRVIR